MISYRCFCCKKIYNVSIADLNEKSNNMNEIKNNNPMLYQSIMSIPNLGDMIKKKQSSFIALIV